MPPPQFGKEPEVTYIRAMLLRTLVAVALLIATPGCGDDSLSCLPGMVMEGGSCVSAPDSGIDGGTDGGSDAGGDEGDSGQDAPPLECDAAITVFRDGDDDGFGDTDDQMRVCEVEAGWSTESGDCDDMDGASFPGGTEVCDDADNDCDGNFDEGLLELGEEVRVGFGVGQSQLVMDSYPVGYVVGLEDRGELSLVSLTEQGLGRSVSWVITEALEWRWVHTLESGTQAMAVYQPSTGPQALRVVDLAGTSVSDALSFPDGVEQVQFVEADGRVFATWEQDDPSLQYWMAEIDPSGPSFVGEPMRVYQWVDPPMGGAFGIRPVAAPDGSGVVLFLPDRREGDLVTHLYRLSISVAATPLLVAAPSKVGEAEAGLVGVSIRPDGAGGTVYIPIARQTVSSVPLDASLSPAGDAVSISTVFAGLLLSARPSNIGWFVLTDLTQNFLWLPTDPGRSGQELELPEAQALVQRTPGSGALVSFNDADERIFHAIGCTP